MCWIIPDKLVIFKQQYDIISGHVHGWLSMYIPFRVQSQYYKSSALIADLKYLKMSDFGVNELLGAYLRSGCSAWYCSADIK